MLQFRLLGFPVFIHWTFWLVVAYLGGAGRSNLDSEGWQRVLVWMGVALISILIHELGHALMMRRFGDPQVAITLHSFGGAAMGARRLSRKEDLVITAAGPFVQAAIGLVLWTILPSFQLVPGTLVAYGFGQFVFISIAWAVLNLLPILPLDGGRIMLAVFGPGKEKVALVISVVCAIGVGVLAFMAGYIYSLLILAWLTYDNFKRLNGPQESRWRGTP